MPEEAHTARPAWYHVLLYALGGILSAAGLICMALQFAIPEVHGLSGAGAAFAVIGSVVVASVAGQRKMDRIRRDLVAHHVVAEEVKQLTLVHLETWSQAIRAEQRDMYERALKELHGLAFICEDADNVFPLPSPETREAAQRLVRRVIQREEQGN